MLYEFAPGTHTLTSPILLGSADAGVVCTDPARTTTLMWGGPGPAIVCNHDGSGFSGVLRNFRLLLGANADGIQVGQGGNGIKGAQVFGENVKITGGKTALVMVSAQICRFDYWTITAAQIGVDFQNVVGNTAVQLYGGVIQSCGTGVRLNNAYGITFRDVAIQECQNEGVLVDPDGATVRNVLFDECWFERNNTARANQGVGQVRVTNRNNGGSTVRLRGGVYSQPGAGNWHILTAPGRVTTEGGRFVSGGEAQFWSEV